MGANIRHLPVELLVLVFIDTEYSLDTQEEEETGEGKEHDESLRVIHCTRTALHCTKSLLTCT